MRRSLEVGGHVADRKKKLMGMDELVNIDAMKKLADSEQGEQITDAILDGVADVAKKFTPDEIDVAINQAKEKADDAIGHRPGA